MDEDRGGHSRIHAGPTQERGNEGPGEPGYDEISPHGQEDNQPQPGISIGEQESQHRDGSTTTQWAPMKKTIYSLPALQETLLAANRRYLKFISEIETPEVGVHKLQQLAETIAVNDRRYKGFNLFAEEDSSFFRLLSHGEFTISGLTNKRLRQHLPHKNSAQVSRLLKRLRVHGLIKKIGRSYKYYLSDFGRQVVLLALKLRALVVIPALAYGHSAQA